jgi:alkylation response protein AidB-like acyl-CoA dehydrogenase
VQSSQSLDRPASSHSSELRAEISEILKSEPPGGWICEHEDLGYGFGAWSAEFLRVLGDRDLIGLGWPVVVGGRGQSPSDVFDMMQMLAYGRAPAEALLYTLAVGYCVYTFGNDDMKDRFLPAMMRGEITFAEALSESGAGSDLLALRTTARRDGNDWIISGSKLWTSNGWTADYALLAARTDSEGPRHLGISAFLVDLNATGVDRRPIVDMAGVPSFSEIFFDNVRVSNSHLIGEPGKGLQHILDALEWDRLWGRCVKAPFLRRELEELIAYSRDTATTQSASWEDPVVQDALTAMVVDIDVCDALFWRAMRTVGEFGTSATHEVSMAKLFADELGQRFYRLAQDVLGQASSLTPGGTDTPLDGRMLRGTLSAHGLMIAGGSPEIQRSTIARRHLGLGRAS